MTRGDRAGPTRRGLRGGDWATGGVIILDVITFVDGRPCIRDTGVEVADVLSRLIFGESEADVLADFPSIDAADIEAAREYDQQWRHPLDQAMDRAFAKAASPTPDDMLALYVELPRIRLVDGTPIKARSSFEAAYTDARIAIENGIVWLAAVGCLCFFDEVGNAVRLSGQKQEPTEFETALVQFGQLAPQDAVVLYALRCALAHNYSLVNVGRGGRAALLTHAFVLDNDPSAQWLIKLPSAPWDGVDMANVAGRETHVNLSRVFDLLDVVHQAVIRSHQQGDLELAHAPDETRRRYIFTHHVPVDEWDDQQPSDEALKWGPPPPAA